LKRVREYRVADEITAKAEVAPRLIKMVQIPDAVKPGNGLQIRLFMEDRARNLHPDSVYIRDNRTGRLLQVQAVAEKTEEFFVATIPVEANCPPGLFQYDVTAIDESGNLRRWNGDYKVVNGPAQ
jgi:hypothetical protein